MNKSAALKSEIEKADKELNPALERIQKSYTYAAL